MTSPRRKLLPLRNSPSDLKKALATHKLEPKVGAQEKAPCQETRFPLDLTALLAKEFIGAGASKETERDSYTKAARRAIMLLDICTEELLRDAVAATQRELAALQQGQANEWQTFWDGLTRDGRVPFREALLYITQKRTFGEALPVFRQFRQFLHDHPGHYGEHFPCETGLSIDLTVDQEIAHYRVRGVERDQLPGLAGACEDWHSSIAIPSVRAQAGRVGGKMRSPKK